MTLREEVHERIDQLNDTALSKLVVQLETLERENERESDMADLREALRASRERNRDLSAEEADELADEAVRWVRQNPNH